VEKIRNYSLEDCVHELHIPYAEAEGLVSGLLAYRYFLEKTSAERIIVPNISIREGMLINLASDEETVLQEEFFSQVIASAVNLGRKFHFDEAHAQHVTLLALKLFDLLQDEHGLDRHARLLLEVAAILHDIGMYVRSSGHHKHSQYIVANSEIFALHRDDIDIISNVVRYHRKNKPNNTHIAYIALQKEDQMLVLKLTAILRLADAMDRGHSQRIDGFEIERGRDFMLINTGTNKDHTLERVAIEEKGDMFEDVFGYKVQLV
jgi:exopolyphosphatase/guanosine-5'-triphosphate,3'-diphosphate pyrophosphatase